MECAYIFANIKAEIVKKELGNFDRSLGSARYAGPDRRFRPAPKDMLAWHQQEIQAERDRKLDAAREQRRNRRQRAA